MKYVFLLLMFPIYAYARGSGDGAVSLVLVGIFTAGLCLVYEKFDQKNKITGTVVICFLIISLFFLSFFIDILSNFLGISKSDVKSIIFWGGLFIILPIVNFIYKKINRVDNGIKEHYGSSKLDLDVSVSKSHSKPRKRYKHRRFINSKH
ncbi:MAG: hypothetical protein NTX45_10855 [Proteobacteria bacterium]|nr:hypothetical protein [Pseudomonadota bacterium]